MNLLLSGWRRRRLLPYPEDQVPFLAMFGFATLLPLVCLLVWVSIFTIAMGGDMASVFISPFEAAGVVAVATGAALILVVLESRHWIGILRRLEDAMTKKIPTSDNTRAGDPDVVARVIRAWNRSLS